MPAAGVQLALALNRAPRSSTMGRFGFRPSAAPFHRRFVDVTGPFRTRRPIMPGYKGQLRATRTQEEFPHHVYIIVPPDDPGARLDAMYDFHTQL